MFCFVNYSHLKASLHYTKIYLKLLTYKELNCSICTSCLNMRVNYSSFFIDVDFDNWV